MESETASRCKILMSEKTEKLDELDLKILRILQEDARVSYREIAKKLNVSVGTVHNRVKKMESEGYIKGYSAILSPYKLGFDVTAVILMQVEGPHIVEIEQELAKYKEVGCIYDITGEFDVMVITRFRSREDLNRFIKNLLKKPHIKRSVTSIALNIVKEDHRLNI